MNYLKKLVGTKSLNTNQFPAGLSPTIIHHFTPKTFMGNPRDGGKSHPTAINLVIPSTRNIPLSKLTSSAIKSAILFPSNSNFHLITLLIAAVIAVV